MAFKKKCLHQESMTQAMLLARWTEICLLWLFPQSWTKVHYRAKGTYMLASHIIFPSTVSNLESCSLLTSAVSFKVLPDEAIAQMPTSKLLHNIQRCHTSGKVTSLVSPFFSSQMMYQELSVPLHFMVIWDIWLQHLSGCWKELLNMSNCIFSERDEIRENNKTSCDEADAFLVYQRGNLNGKCRLLLPVGSVSSCIANLNIPYSGYNAF